MRNVLILFFVTVSLHLALHAQVPGQYASRTIAGVFPLGDGGPALSALLETPEAVAADSSGTLYIADAGNGVIRKVSNGVITTVPGFNNYVYDLKLDSFGNLFIATDIYLYELTPAGKLITVAGNGTYGTFTGDGGPATSAGFYGIEAVAIDAGHNIYICDANNNRIRKITPDGIVRTIAGGSRGFGGDNGPALAAIFNLPQNIAVDATGNLYINDYNNNRVRKIDTVGIVTTIAGNGICCNSPDGGLATAAYLETGPVTADSAGNVYVYDYRTNRIRRISPTGILQPFAGDGFEGFAGDGNSAALARFSQVYGLATDSANNVYVVDTNNERIRMIATGTNFISTVAGRSHFAGDGGPALAALLHRPAGAAVAADGTIYFTDTVNHRVRKITPDGTISTTAGTGDPGFSGDGGPAAQAKLYYPDAMTIDSAGNLYIVDQYDLRVRKITPAGIISTVAGNGTVAYSVDARGALQTGFAYLMGIAVDAAGNLYLSEQSANKIKKVTPSGGLSTYAGTGGNGFAGDGGPALAAVLAYPTALAMDHNGALFIADYYNHRIRKVDPNTTLITTVAWSGSTIYEGSPIPVVEPLGMVADGKGGLWYTDARGVRYVGADGTLSSVAGGPLDLGRSGFAGDGAAANAVNTEYHYLGGIALDSAGDLILADSGNSRIRELVPNDPIRMDIVSGNSQTGTTGTALNPFIVRLTGKAGVPPAGVAVTFAVTQGTATLSGKSSIADATGQAGVSATPAATGPLTVNAAFASFTATFTATISAPVVLPPAPFSGHALDCHRRHRPERLQRAPRADHFDRRHHHDLRLELHGGGQRRADQLRLRRATLHQLRRGMRDLRRVESAHLRRDAHADHGGSAHARPRRNRRAGVAQLHHREPTAKQRAHRRGATSFSGVPLFAGQCQRAESGSGSGDDRGIHRRDRFHPRS